MTFRLTGLASASFSHLYGLNDDALAAHGAYRLVADRTPGFPDRIELRDAEPGESVLLVNFIHQPAETPYRASHAIFVLENAGATYDCINEIPDVLRRRVISLRAFDEKHMMLDADLIDGTDLRSAIERMLDNPGVDYLHAHYAKRGCYAARIERV